jgi:hypothetical protein
MSPPRVVFVPHAINQMLKRSVSVADVHQILATGRVIEAHPHDVPYPTRVLLGWIGPRPLHIVVHDDIVGHQIIIRTAYEPDPVRWNASFDRRR